MKPNLAGEDPSARPSRLSHARVSRGRSGVLRKNFPPSSPPAGQSTGDGAVSLSPMVAPSPPAPLHTFSGGFPPAVPIARAPAPWRWQRLAGSLLIAAVCAAGLAYFGPGGSDRPFSLEGGVLSVEGEPLPVTTPLPASEAPAPDGALSSLTVNTSPAGAVVLLDLERVGVTPLKEHAVKPGFYVLSLQKEGYAQLDTVLWVEAGGEAVYLALPALGTQRGLARPERDAGALPRIQEPAAERRTAGRAPAAAPPANATVVLVAVEPAGGLVTLDGVPYGETPLLVQQVAEGAHTVTVRKEGYAPFTAQIEARAGEAVKVSGRMQARNGSLQVIVEPWGSIFIDGKLHRKDTDVQYQTTLPVGDHTVRVVHPTLGTWSQRVEIRGGEPQRLIVNFKTAPAGEAPAAERATAPPPAPAEAPEAAADERARDAAPDVASIPSPGGIYTRAEEPPSLIGGLPDLYRRMRYPEIARKFATEGKVFLRYVVDEAGRVQNATVVRGIGMGCDEEALRLIRTAQFKPGLVQGAPVKVWHALFIEFRL